MKLFGQFFKTYNVNKIILLNYIAYIGSVENYEHPQEIACSDLLGSVNCTRKYELFQKIWIFWGGQKIQKNWFEKVLKIASSFSQKKSKLNHEVI